MLLTPRGAQTPPQPVTVQPQMPRVLLLRKSREEGPCQGAMTWPVAGVQRSAWPPTHSARGNAGPGEGGVMGGLLADLSAHCLHFTLRAKRSHCEAVALALSLPS